MKSEIMYESELISIMQRKFLQYYIHWQYLVSSFYCNISQLHIVPLHIIYCYKYKITQLIAGFHRSARGFISILHLNSRGRLVQIFYCKTGFLCFQFVATGLCLQYFTLKCPCFLCIFLTKHVCGLIIVFLL